MRDSPDIENLPPDNGSGYITRGRIAVAAVLLVGLVLADNLLPSQPKPDPALQTAGQV